jgi:hypothetical protein
MILITYNILCIWTSQRMGSGKTDSVKCNMGLKWGMQFVLVDVGASFVLLDPSNNVHLGIHQSWQLSPHLFEWELIHIRWYLKNKHCNISIAKCIHGHISAIYILACPTLMAAPLSHASSSSHTRALASSMEEVQLLWFLKTELWWYNYFILCKVNSITWF